MNHTSLHTKLRSLVELNVLEVKSDPERHYFKGEGAYYYNDERIQVLADYTGPSPDGSDEFWNEPMDVAFAPKQKVVLASARRMPDEPFVPLTEPLRRRIA